MFFHPVPASAGKDFLPDEEKYENALVKREEIIKTLNSLIFICEKAINEGAKILHNGI